MENKEILSMAQQEFQCGQLERTSADSQHKDGQHKDAERKNRTIVINT